MRSRPGHQQFVAVMAKHLPPSAATLRLLDLDGRCGRILLSLRDDIDLQTGCPESLGIAPCSLDAVVAFDHDLDDALLSRILRLLRAGGRFIALLPNDRVRESWLRLLERNGFIRLLLEPALAGQGVLIRGERAHATSDTTQRIASVAAADPDSLDLESYRGRYVHLLVRQSPNKPVWQLRADEQIAWRAMALRRDDDHLLLGFSSLPKAVSFLQELTLAGAALDVNKVGKFSAATASAWTWEVLLNPPPGAVMDMEAAWLSIDPSSAAAADE